MVQQSRLRPPAHPPVPTFSQFHDWLLTDAAFCMRQPYLPTVWVSQLFYQVPSLLSFDVCFMVANENKIGWKLEAALIYIYSIAKDVFLLLKTVYSFHWSIYWLNDFFLIFFKFFMVFLILNCHVVYNLNIFFSHSID